MGGGRKGLSISKTFSLSNLFCGQSLQGNGRGEGRDCPL